MGGLAIDPVHLRVERLRPVIAAHRHSNTSYELHYTREGSGTFTVDGRSGPVAEGTVYITGPGVVHTQLSDPADPVLEYCLYLSCERREAAAGPAALFAETGFWLGRDDGRVLALLEELLRELRAPQPDTPELAEALLRQLIVVLTRRYRESADAPSVLPPGPPARAAVLPAVEDAFFYRYRDLTPAELSGLMGVSVRQMQRFLQERFGKTFTQKLTEARMAAAERFLLDTALSISEIAERLGYASIEHFSTAFRRSRGCPPTRWRRERLRASVMDGEGKG